MHPASPLDPERQSLQYAQLRDKKILWLLNTHPMTAAMFLDCKLFPNKQKARRRLHQLAAQEEIRCVGTIKGPARTMELVYCCWTPNVQQLLHEIAVTRVCLRLDAERILRGPHILDQHRAPDAEVWIAGRHYYLELDRGTMGYPQMAGRFGKYADCRDLVLWVCSTEQRRDALRARAGRLRHNSVFTTFHQAAANPHGDIWVSIEGKPLSALPRHSVEKAKQQAAAATVPSPGGEGPRP